MKLFLAVATTVTEITGKYRKLHTSYWRLYSHNTRKYSFTESTKGTKRVTSHRPLIEGIASFCYLTNDKESCCIDISENTLLLQWNKI